MLNRKYERERTFADTVTRVFGEGNQTNKKIYLYSNQSLNFKELACEEMRKKLGIEKGTMKICFLFPFSSYTLNEVNEFYFLFMIFDIR